MSPAVGPTPGQQQQQQQQPGDGGQQQPMPPRPPSNHSDLGKGPNSEESQRMAAQTAQSGYQQPPMGPPAHMMYNNPKMAAAAGGTGPPPPAPPPPHPGQQQMPPYGGQPGPNYGHYGPRPAYGPPPGGYPGMYGRPNNMPAGYPGYPGGQQYSGGWNNSGPPPPQQQQQPGMMPASGKGAPPGAPGAPVPQRHPGAPPPHGGGPGQYPPQPQQHQQMMKGYPPQSGGPPQNNSYNGPPMYNGPGMAPPVNSAPPMYNGPGRPQPPNSASGMGMPPHQAPGYPGSYPMNSYGAPNSMPPAQGGLSPAPATTTGPDGLPLHDETSQQSTLSQSSDRSDGRQTPKAGPNFMSGQGGPPVMQGYPPASGGPPGSPHSSAPSPGGSMGSSAGGHDSGYPRDIASPNWQRTQASPVSTPQQIYNSNSHGFSGGGVGVPPLSSSPGTPPHALGNYAPVNPHSESTPGKITKGSKSSETLTRLYEMDENPDRRMFLDRLLSFMEDRGTPITQCPTISKNPLDIYKLYIFTKERGGYLETTKNKTWKDIAAQLGIGASSSGAYTLKKHYGKNLLPFECHFDRGGMDPGPILAQVEAQTKKKAKASATSMPQPPPAPSPGSQDSRDSYSNSSDPYCGYPPAGGGGGPPPSSHNNYPPSQSATTTPPNSNNSGGPPSSDRPPSHPGSGYPPSSGYGYPPGGPPGNYPPSSYPPASAAGPRPSWPPHAGYMGGPPPQGSGGAPPPPSSAPGDMYGRPAWPQGSQGYGPRPPYPGSQSGPPTTTAGPANSGQPYGGQPPYPDQYQGYGSSTPPSTTQAGPYPSGAPGKPMSGPPAPPSSQSPRPGMPPNAYPYQGQRPPMYPGGGQPQWQNRYPAPGPGYAPPPPASGDRTWAPPGSPSGPPRAPAPGPQWSSDRTVYYGPGGPAAAWGGSPAMMGKSPMTQSYRPDMKGPGPMGPQRQSFPGSRGGRDMNFPPGCVEATPPYMLKRRKYTKADVQPVEGWRLVMALKSGLLMESTWALDVINILLFDDNGVAYFGLGNMPGLLDALLEHWRASLIAMFGITEDLEVNTEKTGEKRSRKRSQKLEEAKKRRWFDSRKSIEDDSNSEFDLGNAGDVDPSSKCVVLTSMSQDFSKRPRFVDEDVQIDEREDELFVTDEPRDWDVTDGGFESGMMHWMNGGGNTTSHIVTHFAADLGKATFARALKDSPSMKAEKVEVKEKVVDVKKEVEISDELKEDVGALEKEVVEEVEEDIVDKIYRLTGVVLQDPEAARKRWKKENLEDENYVRDEPSLQLISEADDNLGKRVVCISTILRNLSFVPGNEYELSKNPTLLAIIGRLLLLHHWYPARPSKQRNYDRGEEEESAESCTSLTGEDEWWWEYLHIIRENVMVILANIAGALDLEPFEEEISRPIFDGLLEWAISSSAYAQDPFPNVGPSSPVSPQRCAIEALCKLSLLESNVDLMLATPPFWRIEKLTKMLAKKLYRFEDQVLREFSINLLYYLSAADSGIARTIALSDTTVSLLLSFIEQAEQNAMVIAQQHGVNALRDNPDSMGTSLDMLRRAANTLTNLSRHKDNIPLLVRQEQRLLSLVMSQILDQGVASILSHVLFNIGANSPTPTNNFFTPPSIDKVSPPPATAVAEAEAAVTAEK